MRWRADHSGRRKGFTLWELLIVMGIIGLLAAMSMPAIKGLKKSNVMTDANQQLLNDLAFARQRAIKDRTTVHVVFVPPSISDASKMPNLPNNRLASRLKAGPYRAYALYAERTAGDQPGRPFDRYLSEWKILPDGVAIAPANFEDDPGRLWTGFPPALRPFEYVLLPFPTETNAPQRVPHLAFDAQGRLKYETQPNIQDQYIWLTTGSLLAVRDPETEQVLSYDFSERPAGNWLANTNRIHLNGWTGRGRVQRRDIQ